MKTSRKEISYLNVLLCLIVIFAHVSSSAINTADRNSWQFAVLFIPWRLSYFGVPGFIFLSSLKMFLNHPSRNFSMLAYCRNRFFKIVVPYIIWNIIYYFFFLSRHYFELSISDLLLYILNGTLVAPFYFIIVIVQFYLLIPLWYFLVKKYKPLIVLIISFLLMIILGQYLPAIIRLFFPNYSFQFTDRVFTSYLFYWIAGCYAGLYYDKFINFLNRNRLLLTLLFAIMAIFEAVVGYGLYVFGSFARIYEFVHYAYITSVLPFFYMLVIRLLEEKSISNHLISLIDRSSYEIFLVHCLLINIADILLFRMNIHDISRSFFFRIIFVFPMSIIVGYFVTRTKKHVLHFIFNNSSQNASN